MSARKDPSTEAAVFARYLLDRDPPDELIDRYEAANARLFSEPPSTSDAALLAFVRRHPAALPYLDAGAGILRPGSLLRRKIQLMAAILEATPVHAVEFLLPPPGRSRTLLLLARYGVVAGAKFCVGALLLALIPPAQE